MIQFDSVAYRTAMLTCAVYFVSGLTIASIGPSLPVLAVRLNADIAALGGLFTAFSAGVILAQFGVMQASRRFSQRATLVASVLLMSIGSFALAESNSLFVVFAASPLMGFGFGGALATGNTLVAQLFQARSAAALNIVNLFFGIGSIIGPAVAATANARFGSPQITLWIGACAMVVLAPVVLRGAARGSQQIPDTHENTQAAAPTRSWLLSFLLLFYTGTEIGFGAWLTLYMISSVAMDAASAALVVSVFWIALTGGRILAAALGLRLSTANLLKLCLGGLLLSTLLLAASIGNTALTVAGVLLFGVSCGPVFPTVIAVIASTAQGAAATSRALALANGGALVIPALLGFLLTRVGPLAMIALLIMSTIAMFRLGVVALRPHPGAVSSEEAQVTVR